MDNSAPYLWHRVWSDYWDRIRAHPATVPLAVAMSEMRNETIATLLAHPDLFASQNTFVGQIWEALVEEGRRRNIPASTTSLRGRRSLPVPGGTATGATAGKSTSS